MVTSWVLELPRADDDDSGRVLLHITSKPDNALDIDIIATEGSSVFKGKVRKRNVKKLRASNYNGKEEDWEAILQHSLLENASSPISEDQKRSLEVTASVKGRKLSINFRNHIDDITQRIGTVELSQNDDDEISLFDWLTLTVRHKNTLKKELVVATEKSAADETSNASLQAQLENLVKAKSDQEDQLISKFVLLLNEKKMKIRTAKTSLDMSTPDERLLDKLRASLNGRHTTSTAAVKRRSEDVAGANDSESDGFETMDVDRKANRREQDQESDRATTASTVSDDKDVIMAPDPEPEKPTTRRQATKQQSSSPPPRNLLLTAKNGKEKGSEKAKSQNLPAKPDDDEETASEDDEL